jgi:hypothetical protein
MAEITLESLNSSIINAHNKHYETSPTGLIQLDESPNGNIIYHLYSTGEISQQKGGSAYLHRSEFTLHSMLTGYRKLALVLPNKAEYDYTYAILTRAECEQFRNLMLQLLDS